MATDPLKIPDMIVLPRKIKKEPLSEDEETVNCRICWKGFVSETALNNHVRMEHIEIFATGDSSKWTEKRNHKTSIKDTMMILNTQKLLSEMGPTDIINLASEDVSYIIIKDDNTQVIPVKRRKEKEKSKDKSGKDKEGAKREKIIRPITGPFECLQPTGADGTCHQIFFSCCEYSQHYRDEHTRRRKGLRCQVCEKPLISTGDENPAPYPCHVCGAGFLTSKELSDHVSLEHVKLKPFQCSICLKRFTQQGGVQQHMRMHTGDRPFPCTFCPKAFTQKSGLDQHLRIHTKVKPYSCIICTKAFSQSVHLKQHMRTHTHVSPFQCGICNKKFKQSSHLNYHLKNHNQNLMTEEQKERYAKLIGMISNQMVEVEIDPSQMYMHGIVDRSEQEMAEQSIQDTVTEEMGDQSIQDTVIIEDDDTETWNIQVVEE